KLRAIPVDEQRPKPGRRIQIPAANPNLAERDQQVTLVLALFLAFADLGALKSEPDPDRRSELALANGDHSIDAARKAYTDGDDKAVDAALEELQESVNISYDALEHASKAPRNNRYYKS